MIEERKETAEDVLHAVLRALVEGFTEHHDLLNFEVRRTGVNIEVRPTAHPNDAAKMIGTGGEKFHALKRIATCIAARSGCAVHISFVEDAPGQVKCADEPPPAYRADWPRAEIEALLRLTMTQLLDGDFDVAWTNEHDNDSTAVVTHGAAERFAVPDRTLADSVSKVFNAIGLACGRRLYVQFFREENHNRPDANARPVK